MLLEKLSNAIGPSSYEGEVRNIIKDEIKNYVDEIKVDHMGNILAHKKGKGTKVLIDAHMDEVGFIITGFNEDGTLKFSTLGGSYLGVIPAKTLYVGEKNMPGVIGVKPIHLQDREERNKVLSLKNMCIDIGAMSEKEAREYVSLGDYAVYDTKFDFFGEGLVKGKALDDRIGCAVLIEALKENYDCDLYASFSIMEEVGERGAFMTSYEVNPSIGIAVEGTICADIDGISKEKTATVIGKGPAISIMDRTSIYSNEATYDMINVASKNSIECQRRRAVAGGNDASAMHGTKDGAKIIGLSVPVRYIHSSVSVASIKDYENTIDLLVKYLKTLK